MRGSPAAHHYLPVSGGPEAACAEIERALRAALAARCLRAYGHYLSLRALRAEAGAGLPRGFSRRFRLWQSEVRAAIAIAGEIAKVRTLAHTFPAGRPLAIAVAGLPGEAPLERSREISSHRRRSEDPQIPSKKLLPHRCGGRGVPRFHIPGHTAAITIRMPAKATAQASVRSQGTPNM